MKILHYTTMRNSNKGVKCGVKGVSVGSPFACIIGIRGGVCVWGVVVGRFARSPSFRDFDWGFWPARTKQAEAFLKNDTTKNHV